MNCWSDRIKYLESSPWTLLMGFKSRRYVSLWSCSKFPSVVYSHRSCCVEWYVTAHLHPSHPANQQMLFGHTLIVCTFPRALCCYDCRSGETVSPPSDGRTILRPVLAADWSSATPELKKLLNTLECLCLWVHVVSQVLVSDGSSNKHSEVCCEFFFDSHHSVVSVCFTLLVEYLKWPTGRGDVASCVQSASQVKGLTTADISAATKH